MPRSNTKSDSIFSQSDFEFALDTLDSRSSADISAVTNGGYDYDEDVENRQFARRFISESFDSRIFDQ